MSNTVPASPETQEIELKALIFDLDGTLADTERHGHLPAFTAAFNELDLGWRWSAELYGELLAVAGGKERIRYFIDTYLADSDRPSDVAGLTARIHEIKTRHYQRILSTGDIPLRPGVARLLAQARSCGMRLAIATTTSAGNVRALLRHSLGTGCEHWFEVIAAGDAVTVKKPASDIYHYALNELGLCGSECLAIEDSEIGLRAARGAAIPTLISVCDYSRHQDFSGALLVLDHLGEPDVPFTVLRGELPARTYVDIDLLRHLHRDATKFMRRMPPRGRVSP